MRRTRPCMRRGLLNADLVGPAQADSHFRATLQSAPRLPFCVPHAVIAWTYVERSLQLRPQYWGKPLFRYRPVDKRLIESLNSIEHYFSSPLAFNDPYDCNLDLLEPPSSADAAAVLQGYRDFLEPYFRAIFSRLRQFSARAVDYQSDGTPIGQRYYFDEPMRVLGPKFRQAQEILDVVDAALEGTTNFADVWTALKRQIASNYGVLCFAEHADSLLMWSHYADRHKGIVLEVNESERPVIGWRKFRYHKVRYEPEAKIDVATLGIAASFERLLTRKSPEWSYEKERRLITILGEGPQRARMQSVTGIILGARTYMLPPAERQELADAISSLARRRRPVGKLRIFQAELSRDEFRIEFRRLRVDEIGSTLGL